MCCQINTRDRTPSYGFALCISCKRTKTKVLKTLDCQASNENYVLRHSLCMYTQCIFLFTPHTTVVTLLGHELLFGHIYSHHAVIHVSIYGVHYSQTGDDILLLFTQ